MNLTSREVFFKVLSQELGKISDLPLSDGKTIGEADTEQPGEALQKFFAKSEAERKLQEMQEKKDEEKTITIKKGVETLTLFDDSVKENPEMLFGGVSGHEIRIPKTKYLDQKMFSIISKIKLQDSALRFRGFVAIFFIQKKVIPMYDLKLLQTICIKEGFIINSYKMNTYEKTKKALFEKECIKVKEKVSDEEFESLFTNQEIFDLDRMVGENLIYEDTERLDDHFRQTKMNLSTAGTLRNAVSVVKANTSSNKFMNSRPQGVEKALIISFRTKRTDDYHRVFKHLIESKLGLMGDSFELVHFSKDKTESFLDTQLFFPELFQVNFMTLIAQPSLFSERNRHVNEKKMEDVLNLNHYRIVTKLEALLDKEQLTNCLKSIFSNSVQLSNFLLHEAEVKMTIAGKMGPNQINDFGIELENYYKILNQPHNYEIYKHFFPDIYKFSKVVFIMRPIITGSFLDEVVLNLFRVNGFTIIKRNYVKLTREQAVYLAKHEKIEKNSEDEYLSLMLDGEAQVVLMSNYAAVEKAKIITDGSSSEWIRANQVLEFSNVDDDIDAGESQSNQMFRNISQLISLGKLYDISTSMSIFKESNERVKFQEKIKFLKALNLSSLNFFGFCTHDQDSTEELISTFLPDCSIISSIYVLLKSSFKEYETQVMDLLKRLGYKILERKETVMTSDQITRFINLIEIGSRGDDVIELRKEWAGQVSVFHIAKPAGKKEMISLLRNFFLSNDTKVSAPLTKEQLYKILVPCWNPASESMINEELFEKMKIFDGDEFLLLRDDQKEGIISYILQATVGSPLKSGAGTYEELDIGDENHIHIRAESQDYGEYQIRIRKLNRGTYFSLKGVRDEYKKIATYYEKVNFVYSQKAPGFYQYRIVPMDELTPPNHIYDCQEYLGDYFLKIVSKEMMKHREAELRDAYKYKSDLFHKDKGSIISFMYGAKLAIFSKKLEKITAGEIKGYGPIKIADDGKFSGIWSFEGRKAMEKHRVEQILSEVTHYIESRAYSILEDINLNLKKILDSNTYKYSRLEENYRLIPIFLSAKNLRVFEKLDNRDMDQKFDQFKTLSYNFEQTLKEREKDPEKNKKNKDFSIIYASPKIGGKYSLVANLFFILNYELKILNRAINLTNNNEGEYNVLINGLVEGLTKHYTLDPEDEDFMDHLREEAKEKGQGPPIDILEMEKFFVILEGIKMKLDIISDITTLRNQNATQINLLNKQQQDIMRTSTSSALDPIKLKRLELERFKEIYTEQEFKLKHDIKNLLNFLHKLNITPSSEEKQAQKGVKIKIEKERYFKPVVHENIDENIEREKYKKNLTEYQKIDKKYLEMEFFKGADVDSVSKHWVNPQDLYIYDARAAKGNKVDDLFVDPILIPNEVREKELLKKHLQTQVYFKKIDK